ncbi:type I secretion C-terminal target domain-containing protein (plasmid) [Methylobacterium aquaticum]|nr:type I secretion C-terminal target domain-containing protein [Methylobacterium aquaticum]QRE78352.1 type I secretion C-terminal target domain-containing protein [Methylobacterium aquaticum]
MYGEAGNDSLDGGSGNDTLYGGTGNDTLNGGTGDDYLQDYEGSNSLSGGDGDDIFDYVSYGTSTGGIDTLSGGAGRDTYRVSGYTAYYDPTNLKTDIITDFAVGDNGDSLDLSNVTSYLDGWTQGTNPFTSGYLRVVADGADTLLQMDRDGNGTSYGWLSLVRLQGVAPSSLTVANFNNGYAPNDVGITATGTSTNERIDGSNSRDTLSGGAGNDTLYGNDGADSLSGGTGNDYLSGGNGNDTLSGGDGRDTLYGEAGNDSLDGGSGNDTLYGGTGNDTLNGGTGDDYLQDYEGSNSLSGGDGDDIFDYVSYGTSTGGIDTLSGGAGRDTYRIDGYTPRYNPTNLQADIITDFATGDGGDVLDLSDLTSNLIGYTSGTNPFTSGYLRVVADSTDTLLQVDVDASGGSFGWQSVVRLQGVSASSLSTTNYAWPGQFTGQSYSGTSGNDVFAGGAGNDTLSGNDGADSLSGGAGSDLLYGGIGNDTLLGGDGRDTLYGEAGADSLNGGSNNDYLTADAGDDILDGGSGDDTLYGGAGNDTLIGGIGDDYLDDSEGANSLSGGDGDDTFANVSYGTSTGGVDTLSGGAGRDTYQISGYTAYFNPTNLKIDIITDFAAGDSGDSLDLSSVTPYLTGYISGTNPFTSGYLRVVADGADTLLQMDRDGNGTGYDWLSLVRLQGVTPGSLTVANFNNGYAPNDVGITATGTSANEQINGSNSRDTLSGGAGDDTLYGNDGADSLSGSTGNDYLYGRNGNDTLSGGDGRDRIEADAGDDLLDGGNGDDSLYGGAGNDTLIGGIGDDYLDDSEGANSLSGGDGDDTFANVSYGTSTGGVDTLSGGAGRDTYQISGSTAYFNPTNLKIDIITDFAAGDSGDSLDLSSVIPYLTGYISGTNPFTSGYLRVVADGADTLLQMDRDGNGTGYDWLSLVRLQGVTPGSLTVANFNNGYAPNDVGITATGTSANEQINGSNSSDTLLGGAGNDTLYGNDGGDILRGSTGNDYLYGGNGNDTLSGGDGRDYLAGGVGDDILDAGSSDDTLIGEVGNDILIGGDGADYLDGGAGTDIVSYQDATASVVASLTNPGANTGFAAGDTYVSIENMIGADVAGAGDVLAGDAGINVLYGLAGNDTLIGGAGGDVLDGGAGTDTASYQDATASVVASLTNPGANTGFAAGDTYVSIENLVGADVAGAGDVLIGDAGANALSGLAGDDTLIGGAGGDALDGGAGIDTASYQDAVASVVASLTNPSANTGIAAGDTYVSIENLIGADVAGAGDVLTGDAGANALSGLAGNDTLIGGAGGDVLDGGAGIDTASYQDATASVVASLTNPGANTGFAAGDTYVSIENLIGADVAGAGDILTGDAGTNALYGLAGNDTLNGLDGNDSLYGGAGADRLDGGAGIDTASYQDATASVVASLTNPGANTGFAAGDTYVSIENLVGADVAGAGDILTGDAGTNALYGLAGNDTLNGLDGNDSLYGGAGSDSLTGGVGSDTLDGGIGFDVASYSGASAGLTASLANPSANTGEAAGDTYVSIEGLVGSGFNDVLIGAAAGNLLQGLGGDDLFYAGPGGNTLIGGTGNDFYVLASAADTVIENANEGRDTVYVSDFEYVLPDNVEQAVTTGAGIAAVTGNDLDNIFYGGAGTNTFNGRGGDDQFFAGTGTNVLLGGTGNDYYVLNSASDTVIENANEGRDTVYVGFSYALTNNVEQAVVTSNAGVTITGNAVDNVIYGGGGNDVFRGGAGNDYIFGGGGDDLFYGEAGADTMIGGAGNDFYVLDGASDTVIENANEGRDTVYVSDFEYVLPDNVEQAVTTGAGTAAVTGNDLDNIFYGGAGTNTFNGRGGDDQFFAGTGTNVLLGGTGNDYYVLNSASDTVIENANEGRDTVYVGFDYALAANIEQGVVTSAGTVSLTGNELDNALYGNVGTNTLNGGVGNDYLYGGAGADVFVEVGSFGRDLVADFVTGQDKLALDRAQFANFAAVQVHTQQVGSDTVITLDANNAVTLQNVQASTLQASDILFI